MKWVAQFLICFISNLFRWNNLRSCRYAPTCSEYGIEAFHHHSFLKAAWLTLARVCRCHPFSAGGYDPVRNFNDQEKPPLFLTGQVPAGDCDGGRSEAMRMPLSPTGQASVVKNTESGV